MVTYVERMLAERGKSIDTLSNFNSTYLNGSSCGLRSFPVRLLKFIALKCDDQGLNLRNFDCLDYRRQADRVDFLARPCELCDFAGGRFLASQN